VQNSIEEVAFMPKKKMKSKTQEMRCPYCGARMETRLGSEIYHDAANKERLLVCTDYPRCNTYVHLYPGSDRPMGMPANGDLRNLRHRAHKSFDQMWKQGYMSRDAAYRWMADFLGLRPQDSHIAMFGDYQCKKVIEKCEELRALRARRAS
jgi:ssDNA-binding Zn-finger/Zn-ribbon topoisomerase 1